MEIAQVKLNNLLKETVEQAVSLRPLGGFSSPRDMKIIEKHNKLMAIVDSLEHVMRKHFDQDYEIRLN